MFIVGGHFRYPRFTCGSFGLALEQLFKAHTGRELTVTYFGKPLQATFQFAEETMQRKRKLHRFYS